MHISFLPSLRYKSRNGSREQAFLVSFSAIHFSVSAKRMKKNIYEISSDFVFFSRNTTSIMPIQHVVYQCFIVNRMKTTFQKWRFSILVFWLFGLGNLRFLVFANLTKNEFSLMLIQHFGILVFGLGNFGFFVFANIRNFQ